MRDPESGPSDAGSGTNGAYDAFADLFRGGGEDAPVLGKHGLLQWVLATLPVGVAVMDQTGNIVLVNAASQRIWGGATIVPGPERWAQSIGYWHDTGERIPPAEWASARTTSPATWPLPVFAWYRKPSPTSFGTRRRSGSGSM